MNILLTGGSGFIGRNIRESYLSEKYNIVAPSHKNLDLLDEGSVLNFFQNNDIDIVIHSAVKPGHRNSKNTDSLFYTNTRMFCTLERCCSYYKKMIVFGSGAIYDNRNYYSAMKEESYIDNIPSDEHGFCKYVCEKIIEKSDNIIDLRIFGIFGKYEDYEIRFISNMICKALFNLPMTIKQDRIMSFLFIDDLYPVLEYFIENETKYKSYNVVPDDEYQLSKIAERVKFLTKTTSDIIIENQGFGSTYSGCNLRLKKEIPGLTFSSLDDSLKRLISWYEENMIVLDKRKLLFNK